ncbi:hypothetical protein [Anaerobaca lacustris]|uniref:Uncharacterized protein n=1 Tax=Anaerobaca lacustris TaxID=3044600 RepID=A0AAW6TUS0_9BACT|nr:hypothetical protein [Sedimentisphaerales bacterium M17dextr]
MKELGKVIAILNEQLLLITCEEQLEQKQIVTVFGVVSDRKLSETTCLERVLYPKGELRVICIQEDKTYLAECFREVTKRKRRITTPSPFQRAMFGLVGQLEPETKEVEDEVSGPWSAALDPEQVLGLTLDKTVHVGDTVGRM